MEVTFLELKKKYLELEKKKWELLDRLQHRAADLSRELLYSLGLESNAWNDSGGTQKSYVEPGVWGSDGVFKPCIYPRLGADASYRLNFVLSITLDDTPGAGGPYHLVNISLWYEGAVLKTSIGSGETLKNFQVSEDGGVADFAEVCGGIKNIIFLALESALPNFNE